MSHPSQIDEITVDWLNAVLSQRAVLSTERVVSFEVEPVTKQGLTSMAYILTLSYDQQPEAAPTKLIAKFSLDNQMVREALNGLRGYQREVTFYNNFGEDVGIPIPRCYAAEFNADDSSCMLLLEYRDHTCERDIFNWTVPELEMAIEHLAAFHAKWWGREAELKGVYSEQDPFLIDLYVDKLTRSLDEVHKQFRDQVGETLVAFLELWVPNARILAERFQQGPRTLCHSDFHWKQLLFPANPEGSFCVLDWQQVSIDYGPTDLARLIVSGLLPDQRREHERRLVEKYHALLVEHGVQNYSLEDTWQHYSIGIAELVRIYMCAFETGDLGPALAWWETQEMYKGLSFWDVSCHWPAEALEEHRVLERLAEILQTNS